MRDHALVASAANATSYDLFLAQLKPVAAGRPDWIEPRFAVQLPVEPPVLSERLRQLAESPMLEPIDAERFLRLNKVRCPG